LFATFFEKKVAPKNFQREVFSAHSTLNHRFAVVGRFFIGRFLKKAPQKLSYGKVFSAHCSFDLCAHTPLIVGTGVLDCPKK
jgi:hypothetical protein